MFYLYFDIVHVLFCLKENLTPLRADLFVPDPYLLNGGRASIIDSSEGLTS